MGTYLELIHTLHDWRINPKDREMNTGTAVGGSFFGVAAQNIILLLEIYCQHHSFVSHLHECLLTRQGTLASHAVFESSRSLPHNLVLSCINHDSHGIGV